MAKFAVFVNVFVRSAKKYKISFKIVSHKTNIFREYYHDCSMLLRDCFYDGNVPTIIWELQQVHDLLENGLG